MTPEVEFTAKGKVVNVTYYCDTAKYGVVSSHGYLTNQPVKYKEPKDRKSISQSMAEAKARAAQPAPAPIKVPAPTLAPVPNIADANEGDAAALNGKATA
jgi:hypothetical protein